MKGKAIGSAVLQIVADIGTDSVNVIYFYISNDPPTICC